MERIIEYFILKLSGVMGKPLILFCISLFPILELRGGILAASEVFLNVPLKIAIPVCLIGNFFPIPFILILIKKIFLFLKKNKKLALLIEKVEQKALSKSEKI